MTFISAQQVISSQVWFGSSRLKLTSYQVRTDAVFSQTLSIVIVEFSKTQHFSDKSDMLVNIHSTLQMPSQTPVLTVIDPGNCALAVKRIFGV